MVGKSKVLRCQWCIQMVERPKMKDALRGERRAVRGAVGAAVMRAHERHDSTLGSQKTIWIQGWSNPKPLILSMRAERWLWVRVRVMTNVH